MKKVLVGCGCLLFIGVAVVTVIFAVVLLNTDEETEEIINDENNTEEIADETNEQEENTNNNENNDEEIEFKEKKIKIGKEFEVNGAYIKLQSLYIKENRTNLYATWTNKTLHEVHLDYLAPLEITQGDEMLEIKDRDKLLRRVKSGIDGTLNLNIELLNYEDDVILTFYDFDNDTKEEIKIELN